MTEINMSWQWQSRVTVVDNLISIRQQVAGYLYLVSKAMQVLQSCLYASAIESIKML